MTDLKQICEQAQSGADFARLYVDHVTKIIKQLDCDSVAKLIDLFIEARSTGSTIFFMGNGGSAATASHFANDLGFCASPDGRTPFRAVSLAGDNASITCLANDIGYENVFARQLRNLMRPGDIVVGISASGNSENIVRGLKYARDNGGIPVAIVGFDGGKIMSLAEHVIHVETEKGEFGPVEDVHMVLDHLISNYLATVAE